MAWVGSNRTFMELKYDYNNLMAVCKKCSNRTFMELKYGRYTRTNQR